MKITNILYSLQYYIKHIIDLILLIKLISSLIMSHFTIQLNEFPVESTILYNM